MIPHKLDPVCIWSHFDEPNYMAIDRRFRYRPKILAADYHAQRHEHVWMTEAFPCCYFLAEPLLNRTYDLKITVGKFRNDARF